MSEKLSTTGKKSEERKAWRVKDLEGKQIAFFPLFETFDVEEGKTVIAGNDEVECRYVDIVLKDKDNKEVSFKIGFQELFMFVYFAANEEIRQNLLLRQKKQITYIPYEVSFQLSKAEQQAGMAKRLIKLPVDEIAMAQVRAEAQLLRGTANLENVETWFARRAKKGRIK